MSQVFLDTIGLIALWDRRDQWHAAANNAFVQLDAGGAALFTTSYVLLECGNAAARRPYRAAVDRFRRWLTAAGGLVIPTDEDWISAWASYSQGEYGDAGIVDYMSFATMRKCGATEAFTNDRHFEAAGFKLLF